MNVKPKSIPGVVNVREELIAKGIIRPNGHAIDTVECGVCKVPFDRLLGRTDKTCGYCIYVRKEKKAA